MSCLLDILTEFEKSFDPQDLSKSHVRAQLVGYGEISAIFSLEAFEGWVFKRMPLFETERQAQQYLTNYHEYCRFLKEAGVDLPPDDCFIIPKRDDLFVLYISQKQYPAESLCHKRIHKQTEMETGQMLLAIIERLNSVWAFNEEKKPTLEIAIDGQLSNWVWEDKQLIYIDTSTPLFKRSGEETMNPDLVLKSAPGPLKAIIKLFFLDDVMNRYYSRRDVFIDLVANLYKEQRPELIPFFLDHINRHLPKPINRKEIDKYYKEDKLIWVFFLNARRIDRWVKQKILRQPYEFILPGKIKR